jgi:hypothetical protein
MVCMNQAYSLSRAMPNGPCRFHGLTGLTDMGQQTSALPKGQQGSP